MAIKKRKAAGGKQKPSPRKIARRKPARKAVPKRAPPKATSSSFHDLLISRIGSPLSTMKSSDLLIELLYNLTPSTRAMGYNSGFQAGYRLSELRNGTNSLHILINALTNAGFSNILYHPHKSSAIFEMSHHQDCKINLDATLHIFESGLIAGYLTHSTGRRMIVMERACAHGGNGRCQFVAEQIGDINAPVAFEGTEQLVRSIKSSLSQKTEKKISTEYFSLALLPLTAAPVKEQLAKLLFLVGSEVSREIVLSEANLPEFCRIFSLDKMDIETKKGGISSIGLTFNHLLSNSGYVELASSFFSGMVFRRAGAVPRLSRRIGKGGSYVAELRV
ncbi:MAG: 4-vinyl reductase [Candidatus Micrarchaeota archaeon]|nr:4-vinyl reductase [Candidatus Micrarchaeota archaeon]